MITDKIPTNVQTSPESTNDDDDDDDDGMAELQPLLETQRIISKRKTG